MAKMGQQVSGGEFLKSPIFFLLVLDALHYDWFILFTPLLFDVLVEPLSLVKVMQLPMNICQVQIVVKDHMCYFRVILALSILPLLVPLEILSSPLQQIQLVLVSLICRFVILWYKLARRYSIACMHQVIYITIKEYCHCSEAMEHKT